ncbi:MAG: hypothetical protein SNG69_03460 [Rikenellaceae bacterium]
MSKLLDNILISTKGLLAAVPCVGGSITSIWSDIEATQAKRKMERIEHLFDTLNDDVVNVKDLIKSEYISQPDFLDVFEQTAKYVVNERREEKRTMFKNIFVNSMIVEGCSYDRAEKYMRTLEPMNSLELLILRILMDPKSYNISVGEIVKDPNWIRPGVRNGIQYSMAYNFFEMLRMLLRDNADESDVYEAVMYLENNRLVVNEVCKHTLQTNGHPIHTLDNKITDRGKDFIAFISR